MKSASGIRASLRIILCLSILFGFAGSNLALARSSSNGGEQPYLSGDRLVFGDETAKSAEMRVDASSFAAVELTASASQLQVAKMDLLGSQYLTLSGEGLGKGAKTGSPDLPVLRRDVEIPFGARASLELISSKYSEIKLSDLGLPLSILPLQPAQPKCGDPVAPCGPDAAVYQQDAFFPASPLNLSGEYDVRGHRAQTVEMWPVAYNPVQGTLRLYSEVNFRIRLEGSDVARTVSESARLASPAFEGTLSKTLLNYNMGKGARPAQELNTVNYLIITADAYYAGLANFIAMKEAQGFTVTVAKISVIGATNTAIKNYITTQYTGATPPSYVLFVGDNDTVPNWPFKSSGETSYLTDLYHVTMGGTSDYVPDIYRGRFPVRDASQLANMVNNNLWYTNSVTGAEAWVKKIAYLATDDGGNYPTAEGTHNYCISTYTQPKGYTGIFPTNPQPGGDKLYAITHSANTTNVLNSLNNGRVMTIYSGHGSQTSWAGPSVSQANVRGLTGNLIPYVAGHACVTADFNTVESFADTWVIQNGKGALIYLGASDNSYWDEDDKLQRVMFDTLYDPAPGDPSISQAMYAGLTAVQSAYPGSGQYYWEEYNMFGDPSLVVITGPRNPDFTLGASPVNVEVCNAGAATSTISVGSINSFATPVDLSLSGAPAGVTSGFAPSTVTPAGVSILTLTNDGSAAAGLYSLSVGGTAGTITHSTQVDLGIFTAFPGASTLQTPANGAINQPDLPVLAWLAGTQASTYDLQVATDSAFNNLVVNKTGITTTNYTLTSSLNTGTKYYWRVTARNACGAGTTSAVFNFTTAPAPGDCSPGYVPQTMHFTDVESGLNGWADTSTGTYHWAASTVSAHSPTHSVLGVDPAALSDQWLTSPSLALPAATQQPITFSFWQSHSFEGSTTCYDAGILEISTNGGTSWSQLTPMVGTYGYNGTVSNSYSNPLAGKTAWCFATTSWQRTVADLSAYAGQSIKLRFRLGSDSSVGATGWYVDDLRVQSCVQNFNFTMDDPAATTQFGDGGQQVDYTFEITNLGLSDSYTLEATAHTWTMDMPAAIGPLATGETATVTVSVHIPAGVAAGSHEQVLVTAKSQGNTSMEDSFTLDTWSFWKAFLPTLFN